MNSFNNPNDTSGYFEKIRGTKMFYDSPCDSRKSMITGKNELCVIAEIGQWHANNLHDFNMHEARGLNVLAK